jgi:hypothetical protein
MTKKKLLPQQFDQMFEGNARFIVANGDRFTQTCCDCGSSHDIILTVQNDHWEIQVELIKNLVVTHAARLDGCNGVLMSTQVFGDFMEMIGKLADGKKITRADAIKLLRDQTIFGATMKAGVVI